MLRTMTLALAVPLALAAICGIPKAEAADRFGVVGIENATQVTIRLQHRWGDGQWTTDAGGRK
jgi:hypothetical protein